MIQELSIDLSNEKFSNAKRILKHKQFIIGDNLEMYQAAEVVFPEMADTINNDETLSEQQKAAALERFKAVSYDSRTEGTNVNAATGEMVEGSPEGVTVVSELEFWQTLPASFFTGANLATIHPDITFYPGDTLAELVYNGLLFSKAKMRERNRV